MSVRVAVPAGGVLSARGRILDRPRPCRLLAPVPRASRRRYGANSLDGRYALFPCGSIGSTTRNVMRVDWLGNVDTATTWRVNTASYPPRGVASPDGSSIYTGADATAALLMPCKGRHGDRTGQPRCDCNTQAASIARRGGFA